jgi:hypothetical protein
LALAIEGLEARDRYSMLEPHPDVVPLVWLMSDFERQL